jgi:Ca2+-binding EF-hand superfamily protein
MHINTIAKILKFFNAKSGKLNEKGFYDMYNLFEADERFADDLDKHQIVSLMFRLFDTNHDGLVTLNE